MDLSTLARSALRPAYTVARIPFHTVERALGSVVAAGDEPRATLSRVLGTADQLVGMVLEDDALVQRGARLRESADSSRRPDAWSSSASPAGPPPADPAPPFRGAETGTAAAGEPEVGAETGAVTPEPTSPGATTPAPTPEPAPEPVDLADAVEAEQARADAAAALAEVDLEPASPGDEHHLVGHHVDAAAPVDKAAFAEEQRRKADREMNAQEAERRNRGH
ncbi:hypothetical protein GCM10027047_26070 [Rhodococcus aerolatus]